VIVESNAPVFYYDLGSPFSYLAAFRIARVFPVPVEWRPIWAAPVIAASGRDWMHTFEEGRERRAEIVGRASRYGMPDWRWPPGYEPADEEAHAVWEPPNALALMRLATYARDRGVAEAFSLGAFHLVFGEGRDITQLGDGVIAVATGCGLTTEEALAAPTKPEIKASLRSATEEAVSRGVVGVPTVAIGERLYWGDDRLEEAAAAAGAR
jgi:2-hydroxychromene-2-carboxylate isomerase